MTLTLKRLSLLIIAILFSLTIGIVYSIPTNASELVWSEPVYLSEGPEFAGNTRVATSEDGAIVHAIWNQGAEVIYSRSNDSGQSWTTPVAIPGSQNSTVYQEVETSEDGQTVTLVWRSPGPSGRKVNVSTSLDGGLTWSSPYMPHQSFYAGDDPRLVVSGDGMKQYVLWMTGGSQGEIQGAYSTDSGATWSAARRLSVFDRLEARNGRIEMSDDGTKLFATWHKRNSLGEYKVESAQATFGTDVVWSAPQTVSNILVQPSEGSPTRLELSGSDTLDELIVGWRDAAGVATVAITDDGGQNWSEEQFVESFYVDVAVKPDGSSFTTTWTDALAGITIEVSSTNEVQSAWSGSQQLSSFGQQSKVEVSDDNIFVFWRDRTTENTTFAASKSTDNGATWEPKVTISNPELTIGEYATEVGGDGANIYVMWDVLNFPRQVQFSSTSIQPSLLCNGLEPTILGTEGDDVLTGTSGIDVIMGLGGNDTIKGKQGDDIICGGGGNDTIHGDRGNDTIFGDAGDDELRGNENDDTITDLLGNNTVYGGTGSDAITTGDGDDDIQGNQSADVIDAGDGDNIVVGGTGADTITTGSGNDDIQGNQEPDVITSGAGNDVIEAGFGDDVVDAGQGDDDIEGNQGADFLDGGLGTNTIDGGTGTDTCINGIFTACEL